MKINRFLGLCTALMLSVLCIGAASAIDGTQLKMWWDMDGSATSVADRASTNNGTVNLFALNTITKLSNFSQAYTPTTNAFANITNNNNTIFGGINSFTFIIIAHGNNSGSGQGTRFYFSKNDVAGNSDFYLASQAGTATTMDMFLRNTTGTINPTGAATVTANVWYCWIMNYDGTRAWLQQNSTTIINTTFSGTINNDASRLFSVANTKASNVRTNSTIQQFIYFNRSLTFAESQGLCQSPALYVNSGVATNLTITAVDSLNGTSLTTFNATVNGTLYTTTTGTITTNINIIGSSGTVSAEFTANNYHTNTTTISATANAQAQLQPFVILRVRDSYNSSFINTFNTTVNGTSYTTTNGLQYLPIFNSTYNITVNANNYFNNTTTIILQPNNNSINISNIPYTAIRAVSYLGGSPGGILNFSINYTGTIYSGSVSTTNGIAYIPLFNESYNLSIYDAQNGSITYASTSASVNATPYLHSYNFTLYLSNTINFIFRDEDTNALLNNTTVYAYITGTIGSYNFTTTNGTYNISLILPQVYVITYNAVNYSQRTYYYTLTNQSSTTLTLYLLNSANGTVSLWNAVDTINRRAVPGDEMHVQRKNLSGTNYYTVEICTTDANGECVVTVELVSNTNKPTYRVLHYYGGSLVLNSGDTTFTSNVKTWEINIESRPLAQLFQVTGAYYNLSENHSTTAVTFNYTFVDTYSAINNNCMIVTSINYGASTTLYSNCTTNDNDAMITTHAFTGQQVCARTYATTTNGQTYGTGNIICLVNTQNSSNTGAKGLFYIVLPVFITFIMIFRSRPGLAIMGGGAVLATTYFIGLLDTTSVVIGGVLVLFATIYLANKT